MLGEIHVALLKSIIKDIEDVARTPVVALGASQTSAANLAGGHPQIVEGVRPYSVVFVHLIISTSFGPMHKVSALFCQAYEWGFDIRSWHRHLNFLTWPEILRQFALSAGFGPQLKKRTVERAYLRDDNEVYLLR